MSFPTQTAQYVRVVLTTGVATNWWFIDELNLYGSGSGGTTTTTAATTTTTSGGRANCSASTSGQTQLNESGFTASSESASSGAQNAITNAVNHTNPNRFTTNAAQAAGMYYEVNMGSAQTRST